MVRETRYLWVANLPENVKEERISEHFKRYGKIQSVKFRKDNDVTLGALVAFTDIKSAEKAQNCENVLDSNVLRTEYSEPGASLLSLRTSAPPPPPTLVDGSSNDAAPRNAFRPGFGRTAGEPEKNDEKKEVVERGRPRERFPGANHPAVPIAGDGLKPRPSAYMRHAGVENNGEKAGRRKANGPGYSRSPSSDSSTGSRSSSSSSDRSRSVSNKSQGGRVRKTGSTVQRTASEDGHLGIYITGLPLRSTDSSLRDGLFHEYKKYGKVVAVSVQGQHQDRFAIVTFKKHDDASKAKEGSQGRRFFGAKIVVTEHEGIEPEDSEYRPPEAELDEFHPKATRTLFVGNLEKDISAQDLKDIFSDYGEIIDVDIKKQAQGSSYAFVQFNDINSVVRALRKMDGENIGANKIKLGFGKSMPTNCIWIDNVTDAITEKSLCRQFSRHGIVQSCHIDRELQRALLYYDTVEIAQYTTSEVRGRLMGGRKLQVDFASRDCQLNFFEKMEKTHQLRPGDYPDERLMMRSARPFDQKQTTFEEERPVERRRFEGRAPFHAAPATPSSSFDRRPAPVSGAPAFRGAELRSYRQQTSTTSSGTGRFRGAEGTEEFPERRRRHADEYSQTSSSYGNDDYEAELREYSARSRRDPYDSQSPFDSRDSSPVRRVPYYEYPDRYSERYDDDPRYRPTDPKAARKPVKKGERAFSPTNSDYSQSLSSHGYRSRSESPERKSGKRVRTPVPTSPGHDDFIQPNEDELNKRKRKKRTVGATSDSESDLDFEMRSSEKGAVKRLREEAGYRSGTSDPEALKRKFRTVDAKAKESDSEGELQDGDLNLHKEKKELLQKLKQLDDRPDDSDNENTGMKLDVSLSCRKQMEARRSEESKPVQANDRTAHPQPHDLMDDSELGPDSLNDVPPEYVGPSKKGKKHHLERKKRTKEVFKPPESLDTRVEKPKREPMDLPLPKFAYEIGFQSPKVAMSPRPHMSPKGVMSPQISPSVKVLAASTPPFSPPLQASEARAATNLVKDSIGSPLSDGSVSPARSPPSSPAQMTLEDRIRALDEKISRAESVRTVPPSGGPSDPPIPTTNHALAVNSNCNAAPIVNYHSKYRIRKRVDNSKNNVGEKDGAESVTSRILARTSAFDLDAQRLEQKHLDDTSTTSLPHVTLALNDDVVVAMATTDATDKEAVAPAAAAVVVAMETNLASANVTLPSSSVLSSVSEALRSDSLTVPNGPPLPTLLKPSTTTTTLPFATSLTVDTYHVADNPVPENLVKTVEGSALTSPALKPPTAPPIGILKKTTSPPRPGILKKTSEPPTLCNGPSSVPDKAIKVEPSPSLDDETPALSPVVEPASAWRTPGKDAPPMPVLKPELDLFKVEVKPEPEPTTDHPPVLLSSNKRKSENSSDAPNAKIPKIEPKTKIENREHKSDKKDSKDSKSVKSDVKKDKTILSAKDTKELKPHSSSGKEPSKSLKTSDSTKHGTSKNGPSDKAKSLTNKNADKAVDKITDKADKPRDSSKTHKSDKERTRPEAKSDSSKESRKADRSAEHSPKPVIKKEASTSSEKQSSEKKKSEKTDKSSSDKKLDKPVKKEVKEERKDKKVELRTEEKKDVKKDKVRKEEQKKERKTEDGAKEKDVKKEHSKDKKSEEKKSKSSDRSRSDKEPRDKDGKGPNGSSKGGGGSHGSSSNDKNSGSGSSERNHDNNNGRSSNNSGSSGGGNGNHGNNNNNNGSGHGNGGEHGNQASKEKKSQEKKSSKSGEQKRSSREEKADKKKERVPAAFRELKELGINLSQIAGFSSMYDNIKRRSSKPAKPEDKSPVGSKKRRPSYMDSEGTPDSSDDSEDVFSDGKRRKKKSPSKPKKNNVMVDSSTSSEDDDEEALLKKEALLRKPIKKAADVYTSSDSDSRLGKKPKPKTSTTPIKKTEMKTKKIKDSSKKSKNRGIYTSSDSDSEPKTKVIKKKKYDPDRTKPLSSKPVSSKGKLSELYNEISNSDSSDDEITFRDVKKEKSNDFDHLKKKKTKQHRLTSKEQEDLKKNNIVFDKLSSQIKALSGDNNQINERKINELKSDLEKLNQRQKSNETTRERSDRAMKMVLDLDMHATQDNISRSNSKYLDKSNMITKDSMYNRDLPLSLTETKAEPKLNSFDIHRVHDEQARKKHKAKQRQKHENALLGVKDLNRINYEKKHHEYKQRQNDSIKLNDVASFNKPIMFNHVNHSEAYFDDVHVPIENDGVDNVAEEQTVETMFVEAPTTVPVVENAAERTVADEYKLRKDVKREDSDSEPLPELIIEEEPRKEAKVEDLHDQPELELKRSAEETSQAAKMLEEVVMNDESWNCSSGLMIEEDQPDETPVTGQDELEAAIASLAGLPEEEPSYREVAPVAASESDKDKSFGDRSFSETETATKLLEGNVMSPLTSPTAVEAVVATPEVVKNVEKEVTVKTPEVAAPETAEKLFPTTEKIASTEILSTPTKPEAEETPEVVVEEPVTEATPDEPTRPLTPLATPPVLPSTPLADEDDSALVESTPEVETPHSSKHKKKKHHHHHKKRQRRDSRRSTDQELDAPHLDTALVIADDKIQVEPPLAPLEHLQSMSAELFKPREEAPSVGTETDSKPDHVTSSGDDMKPSLPSPPHTMTSPSEEAPLVPPLVISTDKTPKRRTRKSKVKIVKEPMSDISLTIDGVLNDYDETKIVTPSTVEIDNNESRSESKMSESSCDSTETGTSPRRKSPARTPGGGVVSDIKTRLRPENKRRKPRRSLYMDENENKDKLVVAPVVAPPEVQTLSEKEREKKMSEYDFRDEFDEDTSVPTRFRPRDEAGKDELTKREDLKDEAKDEGQLVIDEGEEEDKTKKKKKRRDGSPRTESKGSPAQAAPTETVEEERPSLVTVLQVPVDSKKKRVKRKKEHSTEKEESHDEFQFKEEETTDRLQDEVIAMAERAAADAEVEDPKKKLRTKTNDGISDFLSNIDKIIAEVADGNFDIKSIQDDPSAPPRRRGSRSNSKLHDDRPPSRDSQTPTAPERARKSSQSEQGNDSMPPPQFAPYHERFHPNRPASPDKSSPITPATPLYEKQRLKSPDQQHYREERTQSPPTSSSKSYHYPAEGLVMVAREQDRHELSKYPSQGERVFFPPERHLDRKDHSSKSPSGKLSPRSQQSVHMGVVQGAPFTIAQREALERSGQMIERVPNPNLAMMTDGLMSEKLSPSEVAKLHSPKQLVPPPQILTSEIGMKSSTPLASPNHPQLLHGQQKGPPGAPGPSELRVMLSQPPRIASQAGLRPPSNPSEMQHSPQMRALHPDPRRESKHELPAHLDGKLAEAYLRSLPSGDPRPEYYHPDFLQPGLMYGPGIPVALDPRMFPGQRPEFITQQTTHIPITMVHPQQYPASHGRLTPDSRPPSRPLSAHGQHGIPMPGPGLPFFQMNAIDAPTPTDHLLKKYPVMWQGCLALKNDSANVQMHFVSGGENLVRQSLPDQPTQDGNLNVLRIAQRMRLEASQLDAVAKRMEDKANYCMLLALPCGRDDGDLMVQTEQLKTGFIHYLQLKQAAGIVNTNAPGTQQAAYVVHIFPPCDFSKTMLARAASDLLRSCLEIPHVLIVIATV